jgi:FkbM family methyltransferase
MPSLPLPIQKRLKESLRAGCRALCRPIMPMLPDAVANRLPFLGRVGIAGPGNVRLRFLTHGPAGKDRIAIKLARRGLWAYEGETTRVFLALAQESQTVIDIGANTGLFAILAAKANPKCRVWAFEPVPFIFDMLEGNIRLNQLANLQAVPLAVADAVGEISFYVTRTNGRIPTDSSSCSGFREKVEATRLPATTLDDYVSRHSLPRLDLIKIDAETTEIQVVRGAHQTLREHRPLVICEVLPDLDHRELEQMLTALDYRFFHVAPGGLSPQLHLRGFPAKDERNYLFVPREKENQIARTCGRAAIPLM